MPGPRNTAATPPSSGPAGRSGAPTQETDAEPKGRDSGLGGRPPTPGTSNDTFRGIGSVERISGSSSRSVWAVDGGGPLHPGLRAGYGQAQHGGGRGL